MKEKRRSLLVRLAIWTWSWVITAAIATFGPQFIWNNHEGLTALAIAVNLINGIAMIIANRRLFDHYDELERKLHLESMGLTLGLTVIVGLAYSMLDQTNLITSGAEIGFLIGFMGITYLVTLLINRRRFL